MKVDRETVAHIAALAQLELDEAEAAAMERDLASILAYVEQLNELDLAGVEPMAQAAVPGAESERMRPDEPRDCFTPDQATANAPRVGAGCFKVPRVINPT